jgi:hypothetical protein
MIGDRFHRSPCNRDDMSARPEQFRITTAGDLEAVIVAETYDLLSSVFGPYTFEVSGLPGQQQAVFASESAFTLFCVWMYEFVAQEPRAYTGPEKISDRSLFGGGLWLAERYATEAKAAGLDVAGQELLGWLERPIRVRFWSGSLGRHVSLNESFRTLMAPQAHFAKHSLLKLGREITRLREMAGRANCPLTEAEAVDARDEFRAHLEGMMEYHATELAELAGRYFLSFFRFVRGRYEENPTNRLDQIRPPADISDEVYRSMYASAVVGLARWTERRIESSIPQTADSFKNVYPQHDAPDPPAR